MNDFAIEVRSISKKYRLGLKEQKADTFFAALSTLASTPFRNFRQIRNLSKVTGEDPSIFWALKDVSFSVEKGEVLGIIGHNGAGKSTLLKILSRITDPTDGEIIIKGRVSSLLEVGTGFHPELTGRENVYMNGTIMGMRKREIDERFDEIVAFSGVDSHLDTPVKFYSSGMKVRLGFAVAAHLEPEILIIDEVLTVGDYEFQKKCLGKMKDVAGQGRTVLFVSHNMLAVKSLCDTGILLNKGSIASVGSAQDVVSEYLQAFTHQSDVVFSETDKNARNEFVKLERVSVMTGTNDGTFVISEPLSIEVRFESKFNNANINVNLFFNSPDGLNVFTTISPSVEAYPGTIRVICQVPADFLNDDLYTIDIMVVKDGNTPVFMYRNSITIRGVEPPRKGAWMGKFPGMVRPKFIWTIENLR